jgi:chromosome segregation ATPase
MLVEMLPFALNAPTEDRHEIQKAAADMVEQTLKAKKLMMENVIAGESAKLASLKDSQITLANAASEAERDLAAQKDVVQSAKSALADATIAANASRDTVSSLRTEQANADSKLACAREEKTALESAFEDHFKPMKDDAAGPHFKELEPLLKKTCHGGVFAHSLAFDLCKIQGTAWHLRQCCS